MPLSPFADELVKLAADLTSASRSLIKGENFALPGRRYPIHDEGHARAALSMVAAHGTPSEQTRVRAAVHAKYPGIGRDKEATSLGVAGVLKSRSGRKPISIARLIERHRNGSLYKRKLGESSGAGALVPTLSGKQPGEIDPFVARPGRIPSRDDGEPAPDGSKREDSREFVQTLPAKQVPFADVMPLYLSERSQ